MNDYVFPLYFISYVCLNFIIVKANKNCKVDTETKDNPDL